MANRETGARQHPGPSPSPNRRYCLNPQRAAQENVQHIGGLARAQNATVCLLNNNLALYDVYFTLVRPHRHLRDADPVIAGLYLWSSWVPHTSVTGKISRCTPFDWCKGWLPGMQVWHTLTNGPHLRCLLKAFIHYRIQDVDHPLKVQCSSVSMVVGFQLDNYSCNA